MKGDAGGILRGLALVLFFGTGLKDRFTPNRVTRLIGGNCYRIFIDS